MAKIIWEGNQEWNKYFPEEQLPQNAVKIKRPENILTASLPYGIIPMIICFATVFVKTRIYREFLFSIRFMPLAFVIGFIFALPLHELLHALCYPKEATVYTGVCMKKIAAYAVSFYPIGKIRYIVMSLAPVILGIIPLLIYIFCPPELKVLQTVCIVPSFMGLISPSPDYMDVIAIITQVPKGAKIQASNQGLFWFK